MRRLDAARWGLALLLAGCESRHAEGGSAAPRAEVEAAAPEAKHLVLTAAPAEGDVQSIVRQALVGGERDGRRVLVYVGATWCEPCRRFHQAAAHGDLDAALGSLTLVEFDLDRDAERLEVAAYRSRYIPLFAVPARDGSASGKQVEGAVKGEGAVDYLVPRLVELLASR